MHVVNVEMRDFFLYAAIGIGIVATVVLWASVGPDISHTWFSFLFFTGLLLAVLVKMYWPMRRNVKIWLLMLAFLTAHIGSYVLFLRRVHEWPAFWYLLAMPIEVMIFAAITHKFAHVLPTKVRL